MLPRRPATAAGHAPETDLDDAMKEVLTPANSQLLLIDHQPLPAFAVQSIDRQTLKSNVVALARAARLVDYRHGVELARRAGICCQSILNTKTSQQLRGFLR